MQIRLYFLTQKNHTSCLRYPHYGVYQVQDCKHHIQGVMARLYITCIWSLFSISSYILIIIYNCISKAKTKKITFLKKYILVLH